MLLKPGSETLKPVPCFSGSGKLFTVNAERGQWLANRIGKPVDPCGAEKTALGSAGKPGGNPAFPSRPPRWGPVPARAVSFRPGRGFGWKPGRARMAPQMAPLPLKTSGGKPKSQAGQDPLPEPPLKGLFGWMRDAGCGIYSRTKSRDVTIREAGGDSLIPGVGGYRLESDREGSTPRQPAFLHKWQ